MLFRAIFWIGLVSVLMPHEPDLGLGRPAAGRDISSALFSAAEEGIAARASDAAESGSVQSSFQTLALRSLAQIRADIEESKALRARS
jgi:hypothetical protein